MLQEKEICHYLEKKSLPCHYEEKSLPCHLEEKEFVMLFFGDMAKLFRENWSMGHGKMHKNPLEKKFVLWFMADVGEQKVQKSDMPKFWK